MGLQFQSWYRRSLLNWFTCCATSSLIICDIHASGWCNSLQKKLWCCAFDYPLCGAIRHTNELLPGQEYVYRRTNGQILRLWNPFVAISNWLVREWVKRVDRGHKWEKWRGKQPNSGAKSTFLTEPISLRLSSAFVIYIYLWKSDCAQR